jgi:protein involved in polysaccharide export with SLBB domain
MIRCAQLLALLLAFAAGPLRAQNGTGALDAPVLMPGDRLEIVVYLSPDLSGTYTVTSAGTLLHPLFEHVRVAEMPIGDARARMLAELRTHLEEPLFTFEPRYRVYVGGEVRTQGEYHFPEMTIGQAIVNAGGSTAPNRRHRVRLIRDQEVVVANLDGGSETALLQTRVQSGDQILVELRPTFTANYLGPALQAVQTVTALVATYVYLNAIFGS